MKINLSRKGIRAMEWKDDVADRREHTRYYPDEKNTPKAYFIFSDGTKVPIYPINISRGGMMGFISNIEHFVEIKDQNIDLIEIHFPDKKMFRSSGRILRLQTGLKENKYFCAVEFSDIEKSRGVKKKDSALTSDEPELTDNQDAIDWKIIQRIKKVENYYNIDNIDRGLLLRQRAYDSFDDIVEHLTIEEKWLFYEMLDEMKRYEPDYPENLKQAFLRLCRVGNDESIENEEERFLY